MVIKSRYYIKVFLKDTSSLTNICIHPEESYSFNIHRFSYAVVVQDIKLNVWSIRVKRKLSLGVLKKIFFSLPTILEKQVAQIDLQFSVRPTENIAKDPIFQLPFGPGLLINPSVLRLGALRYVLVVKLKVYTTLIVSWAYNVSNRFLENVPKFQQFFDLKN